MTLELSDQEFEIVIRSLASQPYQAVAGLIPKLVNQANETRNKPAPVVPIADKPAAAQ